MPSRSATFLLCCFLLLAISRAGAADTPAEWKLSVALGPTYAMGKAAELWATLATDASKGRFAVRVIPGSRLAGKDPTREVLALRDQRADLAVGTSLNWSAHVPELAVASLPWIAPEPRALAALAEGDVARELVTAVEKRGGVVVAIVPLGYRVLATVKQPAVSPADLAGLNVRMPAVPLLEELYTAWGAQPRTIASAAARQAFDRGEIDAQDGTALAFANARLDAQGIRHITVGRTIAELALFAVSNGRWETLSDDDRTLLRTTALAAARDLPEAAMTEREGALETLRARGVTITRLHAQGREPFIAASEAVVRRWISIIGEDLVAQARRAAQAAMP